MKFAFVGRGFIFKNHSQAISQIRGKIVDVVDESQNKNAWKEMVKNTKADCIVILTPNDLHFEMAKFSAENKKIVLCEKPLTINLKEAKILTRYPNIFTVCQLRYHPLVKQLKSGIKKDKNYEIEIDISVHRDENYWKSWKGDSKRSGGILFNLGIHYFDLLLYLFSEPIKILTHSLTNKSGTGIIKGRNYICHWRVSGEESLESQRRIFKINGTPYDFSSKENLHFYVYKDFLKGKGVSPKEALKSIELIEKLYASYKK